MLNHFALCLLEKYSGKSLTKILSEVSDNCERTWINRAKSEWQPTQKEKDALKRIGTENTVGKLTEKLGYSYEEALSISGRMPPGNHFCAQLVAACTLPNEQEYSNTFNLLTSIDLLSKKLAEYRKQDDITSFKQVLLESEVLSNEYWRSSCANEDDDIWKNMLHLATAWTDLDKPWAVLQANAMLSMFACWDVDFGNSYFGSDIGIPLFPLVMQRLRPNVRIDPRTGWFMRGDKRAVKSLFQTPTMRLLDFIAVLMSYIDRGNWPKKVPSVQKMELLFGASYDTIISWRDETTLFDVHSLNRIWSNLIKASKDGFYPGLPSSMLVASIFFKEYLQREDGRIKSYVFLEPDYLVWWHRHAAKTEKIGLGDRPSPFPFISLLG